MSMLKVSYYLVTIVISECVYLDESVHFTVLIHKYHFGLLSSHLFISKLLLCFKNSELILFM